MESFSPHRGRDSFTLVELLVVIGILAILTAAVVVVLNPAELLKQGRDSSRMTDLANVSKAVQLLLSQNPSASLGNASTVYVSLADSSSTCGSWSLPVLPAGYRYGCVSSASSTLSNGQGWIPIDFSVSNTQSMARLPLDPSNASSTGLYYTYMPTAAGGYELTALIESNKYIPQATNDGGAFTGVVQKGSSIGSTPAMRDKGLVGYWNFEEGSGTVAYDHSGAGNNGAMYSGGAAADIHTALGCNRGWCGAFNGSSSYISIPHTIALKPSEQLTIRAWVKPAAGSLNGFGEVYRKEDNNYRHLLSFQPQGNCNGGGGTGGCISFGIFANTGYSELDVNISAADWENKWSLLVATYDGAAKKIYKDGAVIGTEAVAGRIGTGGGAPAIIGSANGGSEFFNGNIDDLAVYSRALSDAEILAIYNATK